MENNVLAPSNHFSSVFYSISKPGFLDSVKEVSQEALALSKSQQDPNAIHLAVMSTGINGDARIVDFETFIAQSAWTILDSQGFDMTNFSTFVNELWCQEHSQYSTMPQHTHQFGVQISGFYFLETPENSSMVELHDPRPGKVQASLPMKNPENITESNNSVFIRPEPGMFIFTNSWLPHSFTLNQSKEVSRFVHFNVSIMPNLAPQSNPAIVV
jgi:uncharacterized protein (TIGR02466 family)